MPPLLVSVGTISTVRDIGRIRPQLCLENVMWVSAIF